VCLCTYVCLSMGLVICPSLVCMRTRVCVCVGVCVCACVCFCVNVCASARARVCVHCKCVRACLRVCMIVYVSLYLCLSVCVLCLQVCYQYYVHIQFMHTHTDLYKRLLIHTCTHIPTHQTRGRGQQHNDVGRTDWANDSSHKTTGHV